MAITSSYPIAVPTITDTLVGTKFIENKEPTTNSFNVGDLIELVNQNLPTGGVTIGTANGLSIVGSVLSLGLASSSANGALSSNNWTTFNNKQNALSGTGIVKCTGSTVSYITDGSANWNTAYNDSIVSLAITGTTTKTITLTQQDGGTLSASWANGGGSIGIGSPANGLSITSDLLYIALASGSTTGALSSTDWATFNNKQAALSFSSPLVNSSNTISMPAATGSVDGYLTAPNFNTFNSKQAALNGTGFIKASGTTISYDNSTYYLASNPSGYTTNTGTVTSVAGTGTVSGLTLSGTVTGSGSLTLGGTLTLTSGQITTGLGFTPYNSSNPSGYISSINSSMVTTALGYTPYNNTNPAGYITGINSSMVTTALGYTPYNSSNPSSYVTSSGLTTALGNYLPLTGGYVSGSITAAGGFFNSDLRLKDVISRDGEVVVFKWKDGRDDKTHIGYIAQEVQEIFPDAVKEGDDGMLSVNYTEVLVAKIAELEKRIKQLEK
jgi:hypothetical protein